MPVINGKVIKRLAVPLIGKEEQEMAEARLDAIEDTSSSLDSDFANLRHQKAGLMADLLTGWVSVRAA